MSITNDAPTRLLDRTTLEEWRQVAGENPLAAEITRCKHYLETMGPPPLNSVLLTGTAVVADYPTRIVSAALRRLTRRLPGGLTVTPSLVNSGDRTSALEAALRQPSYVPLHVEGDGFLTNRRAVDLVRTAFEGGRVVILSAPTSHDAIISSANKSGRTTVESLVDTAQQHFDFAGDRKLVWEYACYLAMFGKLFDYKWPLEITDSAFAIYTRDLRKFKHVTPKLLFQVAQLTNRHRGRPESLKAALKGLYANPDAPDWSGHPPPSLRLFCETGARPKVVAAMAYAPIIVAPPPAIMEPVATNEPAADLPAPPRRMQTLINRKPTSAIMDDSGAEPGEDSEHPPANSVGLKGCTYIYAPAGQAGEYAPLACNPYRGCGHGCAYCYVPQVTKQLRADFNAGAVERPTFRKGLLRDAAKYHAAGRTDQVMLSFTTDPYSPPNSANGDDPNHVLTRWTLEQLRDHGLAFCTLSKGGRRALRDIDLFRPDRDAYAATLTTLDDSFSQK